jgi:hypothetical protein
LTLTTTNSGCRIPIFTNFTSHFLLSLYVYRPLVVPIKALRTTQVLAGKLLLML